MSVVLVMSCDNKSASGPVYFYSDVVHTEMKVVVVAISKDKDEANQVDESCHTWSAAVQS